MIGEIIAWIVIGLIAGWLAKLAVPGPEPGGFLATVGIGIVGAFVGGWLFSMFGSRGERSMLGSIFVAFVGAVVFLFIWKAIAGRRTTA